MNATIQATLNAAREAEAALAARINAAADELATVGHAPIAAALARLEQEADKAAQRLAEGQAAAEAVLSRAATRFAAFTAAVNAPAPVTPVEALPLLGVPAAASPPAIPEAGNCSGCGRAVEPGADLCPECVERRCSAIPTYEEVMAGGPYCDGCGEPVGEDEGPMCAACRAAAPVPAGRSGGENGHVPISTSTGTSSAAEDVAIPAPAPTPTRRASLCRCGGLCDSGQPCPMAEGASAGEATTARGLFPATVDAYMAPEDNGRPRKGGKGRRRRT